MRNIFEVQVPIPYIEVKLEIMSLSDMDSYSSNLILDCKTALVSSRIAFTFELAVPMLLISESVS